MPEPLSPDEHRKLLGILGRLGSNHDGERAAAGLLATRLLRNRGLGWDDLIRREVICAPNPFQQRHSAAVWRVEVELCLQYAGLLTNWERDFLRSLLARKSLTPTQLEKVREIAVQLRGRRAP